MPASLSKGLSRKKNENNGRNSKHEYLSHEDITGEKGISRVRGSYPREFVGN
jgi:hypothetical protein